MKGFGLGVLVGALLAGSGAALLAAHMHRDRSAAGCAARSGTVASQPVQGTGADSSAGQSTPQPTAAAQQHSGTASDSAPTANGSPTPQPASRPAPHYDFYQMLPNLTVPVAGGAPAARQAPPASGAPVQYLLQVGSYTNDTQAEHLRTRLARLGIEARIERFNEHGRTVNRVRVGPVDSAEAARIRAKLAPAGIHPLIMPAP